MTQPLIEFHNIDVALGGRTVLRGLTWQLRPGEHWAICGGNGSGKSTFLRLLRGDVAPVPKKGRRISRIGGVEQGTAVGLKARIALVAPELQDRYLQQEWRLTALQVVHSGFQNGDYVYTRPSSAEKEFAAKIVRLLNIEHLLRRNVQQLSTGELRKVLIARALVEKPEILALDEACDGLDAPARSDLQQTLERIAKSGTQLLQVTHRSEEVLSCITHMVVLENGRIVRSAEVKSGRALPQSKTVSGGKAAEDCRSPKASPVRTTTLLRIERASVFLERKQVLHDIDWEIRGDQHWAIFGRNGSGKSTLLKLAFGDLFAAWGGKVSRFEFTGKNSVWDVKRRVGYVAPELQANYRESISGRDVVGSGFFATFGLRNRLTAGQQRRVSDLIDSFGLAGLARKNALEMSYGEFRKMLLLRALVHRPELLICDEPFDGLDARAKVEFTAMLDRTATNGTRLVLVTHHVGDIPDCITHGLLLESGRIILRDRLEAIKVNPSIQRLFGGI